MLIHFSFGSEKENTHKQTKLIIEHVLAHRRLKFSHACYEFLPTLHYPNPNSYRINTSAFQQVGNELQSPRIKLPISSNENKDILKPMDTKGVTYKPETVPMLCFIKIPFNKLKNTTHYLNYGKFGLVFGKKFIKKYQPKQVTYYKEDDLFNDKKIIRYNQLLHLNSRSHEQESELRQLSEEILLYRKPYKLWPSFGESVIARVRNNNPELKYNLQLWQYDRYPEGYDFSKEQEWRIAVNSKGSQDYIDFYEEDIELIIVPDINSRDEVHKFLLQNYQHQPKVVLFPSL